MKKIFSIASALMLALSMGMTSCSNDIDEVVTEQQPQLHKLYLSASVPQTPETRSYIEGVDGKEDAIKITGWKAGDVIYGLYVIVTDDSMAPSCIEGELGKLAFTFNGTEFVSEPTIVTDEEIKYFVYGNFDFTKVSTSYNYQNYEEEEESYSGDFYLNAPLTIDVDNNYTDIPMWGAASVNGEDKLTTDMHLANVAFLCLHNNSSAEIDVRLALSTGSTLYYVIDSSTKFGFSYDDNSGAIFGMDWNNIGSEFKDRNNATVTTIPAGEKAYLPIRSNLSFLDWPVQVFVDEVATPFASKSTQDIVAGKVYKLIYTGA